MNGYFQKMAFFQESGENSWIFREKFSENLSDIPKNAGEYLISRRDLPDNIYA
jgi:hypothetical protein